MERAGCKLNQTVHFSTTSFINKHMEEYIQQHYLNFSQSFYGFSSGPDFWQKRFIAVGLEERGCGGNNPIQEAYNRIRAWRDLPAHPELVDLNNYLNQAALLNNQGMATSRTWDRLADLFSPLLQQEAEVCYGDNFRNTIAQEIILSEFQPLACSRSNQWPWRNWLPAYPNKPLWIQHIGAIRSQYIARRLNNSQFLKLCVIYGEIGNLKDYFHGLQGVDVISAHPNNPHVNVLNPANKIVVFVPHPGRHGFSAKMFFTELGQSLAEQINLNP